MRGKVITEIFQKDVNRITPAYAGKSALMPAAVILFWDHPRLCGEKTDLIILTLNKLGSPPPMRGKGFRNPHLARQSRITPAYAGKSHSHPCVNHCI